MYNHQPNLSRHQRFECHKVRTFFCPYCSYAGYQKTHLKTHIRRRHEEFFNETLFRQITNRLMQRRHEQLFTDSAFKEIVKRNNKN